tara:strand:+ start:368 stop:538 length:171 start_codon:yes stop_codon:yes gene_type:complete
MTANLQEFLGMVGIVSSATMFIVGFRWAIYRLGNNQFYQQNQGVRVDGRSSVDSGS